jgi:hypothetical protein
VRPIAKNASVPFSSYLPPRFGLFCFTRFYSMLRSFPRKRL